MLPRSFAVSFTYNTTEILIIFTPINSNVRASTSSSTYLVYSTASRWVGGSSSELPVAVVGGVSTACTAAVCGRRQQCLAAVVSGGCSGWSQTAAVAAVGTVLGGSRGANASTFRMLHLTFYIIAYVQLPHTHKRSFSFVSHIGVGIRFVQTWY